jgi:hypothetical protein
MGNKGSKPELKKREIAGYVASTRSTNVFFVCISVIWLPWLARFLVWFMHAGAAVACCVCMCAVDPEEVKALYMQFLSIKTSESEDEEITVAYVLTRAARCLPTLTGFLSAHFLC